MLLQFLIAPLIVHAVPGKTSPTVSLRYNNQTHALHFPAKHTYDVLTENIGKTIKAPEKEVKEYLIEYLMRGKFKHVKNDADVALLMKDYEDTVKHKNLMPITISLIKPKS